MKSRQVQKIRDLEIFLNCTAILMSSLIRQVPMSSEKMTRFRTDRPKVIITDYDYGNIDIETSILEEIGEEKKDKIKILKLNVDENPQTPQKFGVRGIPTLMLFKDGNLVDTKVGSLPKNMLESWLDPNL